MFVTDLSSLCFFFLYLFWLLCFNWVLYDFICLLSESYLYFLNKQLLVVLSHQHQCSKEEDITPVLWGLFFFFFLLLVLLLMMTQSGGGVEIRREIESVGWETMSPCISMFVLKFAIWIFSDFKSTFKHLFSLYKYMQSSWQIIPNT